MRRKHVKTKNKKLTNFGTTQSFRGQKCEYKACIGRLGFKMLKLSGF